MNKHLLIFVILLSLLFTTSGTGFCFSSENSERGVRPPTPEQREKLRKRIETVKMWRLTQMLDLDEKTAAELFPLLHTYDKKRAELQHTIRGNVQKLEESIRNGNERSLVTIVKSLEAYHEKLREIEHQEWRDIKNILTVEQQAKLIIFRMHFKREIRDIIAQAKKRNAGRFSNARDRRISRATEPY